MHSIGAGHSGCNSLLVTDITLNEINFSRAVISIEYVEYPDLITALGDDNDAVRRRVAEAIGAMGPAAADAIPALVVRLGDGDADVVDAAREAIRDIIKL